MRITAVSERSAPTPEAIVSKQIKDYMVARGWRPIRMQRGLYSGPATTFSSGEPGMPDYLFLRAIEGDKIGVMAGLWVEMKRPGGKLKKHQPEWHARERLRGFPVWVTDDLDSFMAAYEKNFSWLHDGSTRGQIDLLAGL